MSKIVIGEQAHKWIERVDELTKENIELKKLLKQARKYLSEQETPYSLIKRIDEVLGETTNED